MAIKRIDIVEHLSGRGTIFEKDGEELGEADYEIDVLQTIIDVGTKDDPDAELEGLKETGGRFLDFDLTAAMIEGKTLYPLSRGRATSRYHSARCGELRGDGAAP